MKRRKKSARLSFGGGVKDKDIVVFTRQFATMIDAGLPLVQALEILSSQVESKTLSKTLQQVKVDVESGATYADALRKHPRVFTELYVNMVAAGEAGGILDTILNRLASYIEKAMKLKKKVKGAMVYPAVVTTIAVAVIAVIMIFVVPTFTQMFASLGRDPAPADKDGRQFKQLYCRRRRDSDFRRNSCFRYFHYSDTENGKG